MSTCYLSNGSRIIIMKLDSSGDSITGNKISHNKEVLYLQVKSGPMKLQVVFIMQKM